MLRELTGTVRQMEQHMQFITTEQRKLKNALSSVGDSPALPMVPFKAALPMVSFKAALPIATVKALTEFENTYSAEEILPYMRMVGGTNCARAVANLVAAFYTVRLQASMTWKGTRAPNGQWAKFPLVNMKTPKMIIGKLN